MHSRDKTMEEPFEDAILGISMPRTAEPAPDAFAHPSRYVTPPNPVDYAPSATSSTRYTESPFSHVPTPSSASSYSPATTATSGPRDRARTQSPVESRTTLSRQATKKTASSRSGLLPVRESSISSGSTTKAHVSNPAKLKKNIPRKAVTGTVTSQTQTSKTQPKESKTSSSTSRRAGKVAPVQVPPELAHLNVDPPVRRAPSLDKPLPPLRPSRDGTPSLSDIRQQPPVVQSDLPALYTTYHKRTPSQETPVSATSPGLRQRFGLSPKSKQPSPRIDSAISPSPSARAFARGPTPELQPLSTARAQRTDSPSIGPGPSPSKSPRFGFFSRSKSRTESSKPVEKPKRPPTKGPVAGTGHEGYGRFGFRGRSSSTASSNGVRSPSTDSNVSTPSTSSTARKASLASSKGNPELEEFLRERQKPVVLRGSGSTFSNAPSVSDSQAFSAMNSSNSSSIDSYPVSQLLPSAMQVEAGASPVKRPSMGKRLPSESSEDDVQARYSSLATRRSLTKMAAGDGSATMPAPINTALKSSRPAIDSFDTDVVAPPGAKQAVMPSPSEWMSPSTVLAEHRPEKRWNFFQRAHSSPRPTGKQTAMIAEQPRRWSRTAATPYAMLDPVEPVDDLYEIEQLLQDAPQGYESVSEDQRGFDIDQPKRKRGSWLPRPPQGFAETGRPGRGMGVTSSPEERAASPYGSPELLRARTAVPQAAPLTINIPPSPVIVQRESKRVLQHQPTHDLPTNRHTPELSDGRLTTSDLSHENSPRQARLSPVGRIPRVVSRRDRDRKLPDNSFSRPFFRTQPHPSVKPPGALYTQIRELASPIEGASQPTSSTSANSESTSNDRKTSTTTQPTSVSTARLSVEMTMAPEFTAFAPRKDSQVSYSSSNGNGSWVIAMAPPQPQLDDPWSEYNDLLDDMMPQRTPLSAGSSFRVPFQYANMLSDSDRSALPTPLHFMQPPPSMELPDIPRSHTVPAVLSVPQQIASLLRPSASTLASPHTHTLSELYDDYGDRASIPRMSKHASLPPPSQNIAYQPERSSLAAPARASMSSSRYSRASSHSRAASLPEAPARTSRSSLTPSGRFGRDTQLLDIAEHDTRDPTAGANLRFAALVTSKWLSFGRILFSPAHHEMRLAGDPRVLVLDGLGRDWSYYVAHTYAGASVVNLGVGGGESLSSWPDLNQLPPRNYKQCQISSLSSPFPFPKGYFNAVVCRFPVVSTDQAYQACIQECKRVLRPGGHLEVAALDLDLMNMGNKARSLVRGLKTRMQQHDPEVSLRNVSDFLVQLVGRNGLEEVQRCVVGVPAAGRIPRSRDISSIDSSDSNSGTSRGGHRSSSSDNDVSFAELLADNRVDGYEGNGKKRDEGITKMVAKVGRWWYSQCYEAPLASTDRSIWSDASLLRECEKQRTSFRLLLCYAQKPVQARRRTVSV